MPCRDFYDDLHYSAETYKDMRDKLARIACKAMQELESLDPDNKLFKDEEAGPWFAQHKIDDAAAKAAERAARAAREAKKAAARAAREAKKAALAKLTPEDKKALGIR